MTAQPQIFDRALLARRRSRAALRMASDPGAGGHDFLLRRVAEDISDRLSLIRRQFPVALNLGAHNGALSRQLRELDRIGVMLDTDTSAAMLALCDGPCL